MTERNLTGGLVAALNERHITMFILIQMSLTSGTLYITSLPFDVIWNGNTWQSTHGLGSMETMRETDSEISGIAFTCSGVPVTLFNAVMTERVFKRPVIVRIVTVTGTTLNVDQNVWTGELDIPQIDVSGDKMTIRVTAEHKMISWQTPRPVNFSDAEQRLVSSTDTFFSRLAQMAEKTIVWPSKEFFKQ